ncbi:unnamed protein product, partial [Ixodes persulcatus]
MSHSLGGTPTGTPTPKKRHLPQIPPGIRRTGGNRDQITLDLEERARQLKLRMQVQQRRSGAMTPIGMYSDSEVTSRHHQSLDQPHHHHHHHHHRGTAAGLHQLQRGASGRGLGSAPMLSPEGGDLAGGVGGGGESDGSETSSVSKFSVTSAFS